LFSDGLKSTHCPNPNARDMVIHIQKAKTKIKRNYRQQLLVIKLSFMAIDPLLTTEIIEKLENFLERIRPPVEIRNELDMSYRIENQSLFLFEIRPRFDLPTAFIKSDFAKATYIKAKIIGRYF
jgi:hypothetical protein